MVRARPWWCLLLVGCTSDGDPVVDTDSDAVAVDTDPVDTVPPADTDPDPVDSDTIDSEPVDTEIVPDPWTGGLVDVTGPMDGPDALVPHPGTPDDPTAGGPQPMSISVGDLDGDGLPELVVGAGTFASAGTLGHQVWRWDGAAVQPAPDVRLPTLANAVVGVLDLDGDGHLDLVVNDFGTTIAYGRGDGTFEAPIGLDPESQRRFGTQLAPWDVDGDGWLDLVVAGDCQAGLIYALNVGPRRWQLVADRTDETGPGVMGASVLPIPTSDGTLLFADGNACDVAQPHPNFYRVVPDGAQPPRLVPVEVPVASPSWASLPWFAGARYTSELMPMGASLSDLNGDGRQDLLATYGTPWTVAWEQQADGTWVDRSTTYRLDVPQFQPRPAAPWGVVDPDLDRDGDGDLVVANGDDNTVYALAVGTPIRSSLWRTGPNGHRDVAELAGFGAVGSFHGVSPTDLDGDGDADLAIGGFGSPPRLYRNDLPGGGGVAIRLHGTTSNHLGYGATVDVVVPGLGTRSQVMVRPAQLDAMNEPVLFAGLGASPTATVRVRWPSGYTQVIPDVGPGPLTVVEPELITVDPPARRLRADGASIATIRVVPRKADGTPNPAATVTVSVAGAVLLGPASRDGDGWVARVRAPAVARRALVEVKVDGKALAVRPVLWFE